ncbi:YihY/virulence factor BrkB family protein [Roseitranquillus sediminis]|uniref:YihY/virulence factor BrkB family protein n=1 Tax=Roseitranquillus sediminis TaxID=2809051 RepID=UPI001D0C8DBF|nr:YihY/virulence factor BrkB family protein [Roseitranquillus sediminis]MBM9596076.1 YihY/virulence factor BrkB family protein [Roseitranquillus sediminis]
MARAKRRHEGRGRDADAPTQIPAKGWKDVALRVKDEIAADHVGLIAAGVAFYALLALFPAITACMAIAGLLVEPQGIVDQLEQIGTLLPEQAADIIIGQATSVAGSNEGGLGLAAVVGVLLAIYSASKGTSSLIEGLNVAYDETDERGFIKRTLLVYGMTVLLIVGFVIGVAVAMVLPAVLANFGLGPVVEWVAGIASWVILVLLAVVGLAVLYRWGPDRDKPEWKWATPGAAVATVLWVIGSAAFAFYVANFASYNETFGTLGGVIVLLMWLWLSAYIVLMGAEIDSEMEAQTRADTTVGPDEPMGQRGAVKADRLGESRA